MAYPLEADAKLTGFFMKINNKVVLLYEYNNNGEVGEWLKPVPKGCLRHSLQPKIF